MIPDSDDADLTTCGKCGEPTVALEGTTDVLHVDADIDDNHLPPTPDAVPCVFRGIVSACFAAS
jgi:hypothetical protein